MLSKKNGFILAISGAWINQFGMSRPVAPLSGRRKVFWFDGIFGVRPKVFAPGGSGSDDQSSFTPGEICQPESVVRRDAGGQTSLSYKHGGGMTDVSVQRRQFQTMPGGQVSKIVVGDFIRFSWL